MLSVDETVATELLHAAYGDNLQRMAEVKKGYDPDNLFRLTNNVTQRDSPTPAGRPQLRGCLLQTNAVASPSFPARQALPCFYTPITPPSRERSGLEAGSPETCHPRKRTIVSTGRGSHDCSISARG